MPQHIDLGSFSVGELKELRRDIDIEIRKRAQSEIAELRAQIYRVVSERGYKINEVISGLPEDGGSDTYQKGRIYVCPSDPSVIWKGAGRVPKWLKDYIQSGGKYQDCAQA